MGVLARRGTGIGTITVDSASLWTNQNAGIIIGVGGNGTLNVANLGQVISDTMTIANNNGSSGLVSVNNGTITVSGSMGLGGGGSGTLNISNNGHMTNAFCILANSAGTTSQALITGIGSTWNNANMTIGSGGNANIQVLNGAVLTSLQSVVANAATSTSSVTVNGANSRWNLSSLFLGIDGTAALNILNGGSLVTTLGSAISFGATSTASALVDGTGSFFQTTSLRIANISSGSLTVQNNGAVQVINDTIMGNGTASLQLLSNGVLETNQLTGSSATITTNFNGGILRARNDNNTFVTGFNPGQLTLNAAGLAIDSNGFLVATDNIFSGSGGLSKIGEGTLVIDNIQNYTGLTSINEGTLQVNGELISPVQVLLGARLQGNGTVGSTVVQGVIAPGNSIGTLTINGNYVQLPTSYYEVEINPAGQSDQLIITGTAAITGSNVLVIKDSGVYTTGTRYTIVTSLGGVIGKYSALFQNLPFIDMSLSYDAQHVYLDLMRNAVSFASAALTLNQFNTAVAAEYLGAGHPVYDAISSLTDLGLAPNALNSLSGEIYASSLGSFIEESRYVRYAALNRLQQAFSSLNEFLNNGQQVLLGNNTILWGQGFGARGDLKGNGNAATLTRSIGGFFLGADTLLTPDLRLGTLTGFSHSDFNVYSRQSWSSNDNYYLGIYAGTHLAYFNLRAGAAYSWNDIDIGRNVVFPGFSEFEKSDANGDTRQIFAELGYPLQMKGMNLEPFLGGAYVNVDTGHFFESNGFASLNGDGQEDLFYTTVGIRESAHLFSSEKFDVDERVMLGWQHGNHHINPQSTMSFNDGVSPFIIYGAPISKDSFLIDAGVLVHNPNYKNFHLKLSYMGQGSSHVKDNGITGTILYHLD